MLKMFLRRLPPQQVRKLTKREKTKYFLEKLEPGTLLSTQETKKMVSYSQRMSNRPIPTILIIMYHDDKQKNREKDISKSNIHNGIQ